MEKDYFALIEQTRDRKSPKQDTAWTVYNKNLLLFCVRCSTAVSKFPLPMELECKCSKGLRNRQDLWQPAWVQAVLRDSKLYYKRG